MNLAKEELVGRSFKRRMEEQRRLNHGKLCRLLKKYLLSFCREHWVVSGGESRESLSLGRLNSDMNSRDLLLVHVPLPWIQASCSSTPCPFILGPMLKGKIPRQGEEQDRHRYFCCELARITVMHISLLSKSQCQAS